MKLINMKSDPEQTEAYGCNQYGHGLTLYLNEDQCEALGIYKALKAGTQVTLQANAIVTSATESLERDGDDKGTDINLSLQITELGLTTNGTLRNAANLLYGSGADDK